MIIKQIDFGPLTDKILKRTRNEFKKKKAICQFSHYFLSCWLRLFITLLSGVCNIRPIKDSALLLVVNEGLQTFRFKLFTVSLLQNLLENRQISRVWGGVAFMRHKDNQRGRRCTRAPSHQRHVSCPDRLPSVAGRFSTWSSLHPLLPLSSQCHSLSIVISGSFRTASLSFTLGRTSMSLEGISKAKGPPYHPSMALMSWAYLDLESSWQHAATE